MSPVITPARQLARQAAGAASVPVWLTLVGLVTTPDVLCELSQHVLRRRLQVPKQGELWDALCRAHRVSHEVPKAASTQPVEVGSRLAPNTVVGARIGPDSHAASEVARGLFGMIPVEKEPAALLPTFDASKVFAPITLVRTELPTQVLAQVAAEVNRPVEIEHQVSRLRSEDERA